MSTIIEKQKITHYTQPSDMDKQLNRLFSQGSVSTFQSENFKKIKTKKLDGNISFLLDKLVLFLSETTINENAHDIILIDALIALIDKRITSQLNEILHHHTYKSLESTWRGLFFVIQRTDFHQNIQMEIMNCSMKKLMEDFDVATEILQSGLYQQIYDREYDSPGAIPIAAIVADFEFDYSHSNISLLRNVSKVAAATHCPFISSVGAKFFDLSSTKEINNLGNIGTVFERSLYHYWNNFRTDDDSCYVGLTLNRFLLREPYSFEYGNSKYYFEEDITNDDNLIWGNPAFAFISNINRSFSIYGWAVNIKGSNSGGKIENLISYGYKSMNKNFIRISTEFLLSAPKEHELSIAGFIPLSGYKNNNCAVFFSSKSTQKALLYDTSEANANSKIVTNLSNLFLLSRLAHCLKVIQREEIGGSKKKEDIQEELNKWIKSLVLLSKDPMPEQIAKYPLKDASVKIDEFDDMPGYYYLKLKIRPHFQIEGVNIDLSMTSKIPKKQSAK